jgi:hypothetical protein
LATFSKNGTCTNTQDGTGIPAKRQMQHRPTKNKMERPTASSRLSFLRTGPRVLHLFTVMIIMMMMIIIIISEKVVEKKHGLAS